MYMTLTIFFFNYLFQIQIFNPSSRRFELFKEKAAGIDEVVVNEFYDTLGHYINVSANMCEHIVFAPPTTTCYECGKELSANNKAIEVRYYGLQGLEKRTKVSTRCSDKECRRYYHLNNYGKRQQNRLYPTRADVIEVTDGVVVERQLFEMYCNSQ